MQMPKQCPLYDGKGGCKALNTQVADQFQLRRCQHSLSFDSYLECHTFSEWFWGAVIEKTAQQRSEAER